MKKRSYCKFLVIVGLIMMTIIFCSACFLFDNGSGKGGNGNEEDEQKKEYKIHYKINGGQETDFEAVFEKDDLTVVTDTIPTKPNAEFYGWSLRNDGYERFYFGNKLTKDITLYAYYKINGEIYKLVINEIYDVEGNDSKSYYIFTAKNKPLDSIKEPVRSGYIFGGWSDQIDYISHVFPENYINNAYDERYLYGIWYTNGSYNALIYTAWQNTFKDCAGFVLTDSYAPDLPQYNRYYQYNAGNIVGYYHDQVMRYYGTNDSISTYRERLWMMNGILSEINENLDTNQETAKTYTQYESEFFEKLSRYDYDLKYRYSHAYAPYNYVAVLESPNTYTQITYYSESYYRIDTVVIENNRIKSIETSTEDSDSLFKEEKNIAFYYEEEFDTVVPKAQDAGVLFEHFYRLKLVADEKIIADSAPIKGYDLSMLDNLIPSSIISDTIAFYINSDFTIPATSTVEMTGDEIIYVCFTPHQDQWGDALRAISALNNYPTAKLTILRTDTVPTETIGLFDINMFLPYLRFKINRYSFEYGADNNEIILENLADGYRVKLILENEMIRSLTVIFLSNNQERNYTITYD